MKADKLEEVGHRRRCCAWFAFVENEATISALVGNRVMVTAQGADVEVMRAVVRLIDFAKVGTFDAN